MKSERMKEEREQQDRRPELTLMKLGQTVKSNHQTKAISHQAEFEVGKYMI